MQHITDREEYDSFLIAQTVPDGDDVEDDKEQIQTVETDGKKQLVGYCCVWGAISSVRRDGFKHRFSKGTITWLNPTAALFHHDYGTPLASTSNATVSIVEDDYGAKVTIDLDDTTDGVNAFIRVKNQLVQGMSFGGRRIAYDKTNDPKVIDIKSFVADEVSLTIVPAMKETSVVTSDKSAELQKNIQQKKDQQMRLMKNSLSKFKLASLKP